MALALSEDERSTLEAALAFIDAHYDQRSSDGDSDAAKHKSARTRARNNVAAARAHSKRRAELLRLRDESAALETALAELASRRGGLKRVRGDCDAAVGEMARLSEARAMNRRLRELCRRQRDATRQVVGVLQKQMNLKYVQDLLREASVGSTAAATDPMNDRRGIFVDLGERLRVFSSEATALIQETPRETLLSDSRSRVVQHPTHGRVVEVTSSTQLACSLEDGWGYLMNMFCHKHYSKANQEAYGYSVQTRPAKDCSATEKEYSLAFCDRQRPEAVAVDGLALFEVFESPDWKLYLWASLISLRGDRVRVRGLGWTAMVKSTAESCVLHQRYELTCSNVAHEPEASSPCPQTKFLVESLLLKARRDQRRAEDVMIERFGPGTECLAALFT